MLPSRDDIGDKVAREGEGNTGSGGDTCYAATQKH